MEDQDSILNEFLEKIKNLEKSHLEERFHPFRVYHITKTHYERWFSDIEQHLRKLHFQEENRDLVIVNVLDGFRYTTANRSNF